MIVVTVGEVQQWLESTKMTLTTVDPALAESARLIAFSGAAGRYDTTTWVDATTTPKLIRTIISMLIAAWEYQRAYSEEDDSAYGRRRERQARELLDSISSGGLILEEYAVVNQASNDPVFYPNDLSSASEVYDASGNYVAANDDVRFRMSGRF